MQQSPPLNFYLIASPIGHSADISGRAAEILKNCTAIILEEHRAGTTLLKKLGVPLEGREIFLCNEHNEENEARKMAAEICSKHKTAAILSDAGHPLTADPGRFLLNELIAKGVRLHYVGGPSSILGALLLSGFPADDFYFAGFLPRKENEKIIRLKELAKMRTTIILLEAPYRREAAIQSITKVFDAKKPFAVAFDISGENEDVWRGSTGKVSEAVSKYPKMEFVLVINNR